MAAVEESPLSPAWWSKNLTSRSVKVFHPRPSAVECRPIKVGAMDLSLLGSVMTTMARDVAVVLERSIVMVVDARRIGIRQLVLRQACLLSPLSVLAASLSRCQLSQMECQCSPPDSFSQVNSSRRTRPPSNLPLQVTALRETAF